MEQGCGWNCLSRDPSRKQYQGLSVTELGPRKMVERSSKGNKFPVWLRFQTGYKESCGPGQEGQLNKTGVSTPSEGRGEGTEPCTHQPAGLGSSRLTGCWELGNAELPENSWCWGGNPRKPGRLGSAPCQYRERAKPGSGCYGPRLMSERELILKPGSFVLKCEIIWSL